MTQITAVIFEDAEAWLKENLPDLFTDSIASVYPHSKLTPDFGRAYYDEEECIAKFANLDDHVQALRKLCELIDGKKLFLCGIHNAQDLTDAGNWDAEVADAYFQLVYHGEIIYG